MLFDITKGRRSLWAVIPILLVSFLALSTAWADDDDEEEHDRDHDRSNSRHLVISSAKWKAEDEKLKIKGKYAGKREIVRIFNAASGELLARVKANKKGKWKAKLKHLASVPCDVRASSGNGSDERHVRYAPDDCDTGGGTPPPPPPPGGGGGTPPPPPGGGGGTPPPITGNFTVLAANDLGMHCADQDFTQFSILPPYNVLHAQVLRKGGSPRLMTPADGVSLTYEAIPSNIIDPNNPNLPPIAVNSVTSTGQNDPANGVYKTNFWEVTNSGETLGFLAYQKLYPAGVLAAFPLDPDLGLPAPDVEQLYLGNGALTAEQAAMPGIAAPYSANDPQPFHGFVQDFPFFVNLPFGYTAPNFKRFTAEGIPTGMIDDAGRTNAYPLMRVTAKDSAGAALASVDVVTPVASEADCAICHASQSVCDFDTVNTLACDDIANAKYPSVNFLEDASTVNGATPEQQIINTAKINILRLHDFKHGTSLGPDNDDGANADGSTPNIVCANCHYSPALDLAQVGPNDDNGKEQTQHISMSRAMHGFHGNLPNVDPANYGNLFPTMPPPDQRDPALVEGLLFETCYNCHPGKRTKCLRGAMGGAGTVCQDCHGQMTQVGDDFTENFPNIAGSGNFNKRVSWATEPKCQSCHVGDVMQVASLRNSGQLNDVIVNATDSHGNPDGLRLNMAYLRSDHVSNGGGTNIQQLDIKSSRFASSEDLFRLSGSDNGSGKGHGGLSCENCHGSTHAIWPNKNPFSNDNKAANDLQGHAGPIIECSTCHDRDMGITLDGPHGMHPVGDTNFSHGGHEHLAERNKNACRACHGQNGQGSVLARAATDRVLRSEHGSVSVAKGEPITCTLCHGNKL